MKIEMPVRSLACAALALLFVAPLAGAAGAAGSAEPAGPAPRAEASAAPDAPGPTETATEPAVEKHAETTSSDSDEFRFGQSVTIAAGEESHRNIVVYGGTVNVNGTHHGEITVFGGHVKIAGTQAGDVVVMGGGLDVSGKLDGSVAVMGGGAHLTSTANVSGDISIVGGGLNRDPGSVLRGGNVSVAAPNVPMGVLPLGLLGGFAAGLTFLGWLKSALLTLVVGLLVITLLPERVEAAGTVLRDRWPACLGVGFAAGVAVVPLMLVLLITCVGVVIPPIFYVVAKYFGLTVLYVVLGEALARGLLKRELAPIGSFLVGFAVLSVVAFVTSPLPTWMILGWFGVGCALLTRFGTMRPWFKKRTPVLPPVPAASEVPPLSPSEPASQE